MENRRLMSTAWRQTNPRVSWLHYLMLIACDGARKAGDRRCLHQRKTSKQGKPSPQQPFPTKLLVIFTKQPSWCLFIYMFPVILRAVHHVLSVLGESFFLNNNQCFLQSLLSQPHIQHPQVPRALGDIYQLSHQ